MDFSFTLEQEMLKKALEAVSAGGTNEIMRTVIGREVTK